MPRNQHDLATHRLVACISELWQGRNVATRQTLRFEVDVPMCRSIGEGITEGSSGQRIRTRARSATSVSSPWYVDDDTACRCENQACLLSDQPVPERSAVLVLGSGHHQPDMQLLQQHSSALCRLPAQLASARALKLADVLNSLRIRLMRQQSSTCAKACRSCSWLGPPTQQNRSEVLLPMHGGCTGR